MAEINSDRMSGEDVENLIEFYCSDCSHSCDECMLNDFSRELYRTITAYNERQRD